MGDPSIEVTEENRDASQAAKAQAMEALSEGSMVVVYVILLFVDRLCRAYWFVIIQVSLRKQLSILLRPFLSIQLLPLCMQPEVTHGFFIFQLFLGTNMFRWWELTYP